MDTGVGGKKQGALYICSVDQARSCPLRRAHVSNREDVDTGHVRKHGAAPVFSFEWVVIA